MLHHTPNAKPDPAPQERAFFDWIFSQMFEITLFSWKSWGSFFKHPLDVQVLKEFKEGSKDFLIEKYFKINEDNQDMIEYLVDRLKKQLSEAERIFRVDKKGAFTRQRNYGEMSTLSLVMVFFSYYYFDEYWNYAKVYAFTNPANYTSGCSTAIFCGSASSDGSSDGGGGHGGGSSCSSCSSCGSGCSS